MKGMFSAVGLDRVWSYYLPNFIFLQYNIGNAKGGKRMAKNTHYVVWIGKEPGIYTTWAECQQQTKGVKGAKFKGFKSFEDAKRAFEGSEDAPQKDYIRESINVDVGCSGNPGIMEYRCMDTETGEELFHVGPYPKGTNNIGEFLGVVDALRYLNERGSDKPVYTDSVTAIAWVRKKELKTNLVRDDETESLWEKVEDAVQWLKEHDFTNPIYKWDTVNWGEIKADFGRKTSR
jgi:ribonuclease HI